MHLVLISGSHRQTARTHKVALFVEAAVKKLFADTTTDIIDLRGNPIPLWDDDFWQKDGQGERQIMWKPYAERLKKADALVVCSPEWNGQVPSGLKNFFFYTHAREVGHKPALIVTVSSTRGGSYPIIELRTSGYKNPRILYIPEHVIVQNAETMLNAESSGKDDDYIRGRIDYALKILKTYSDAMGSARASGNLDFDKNYSNGM
jgi:NAD(P)H-dependent FMN reductase